MNKGWVFDVYNEFADDAIKKMPWDDPEYNYYSKMSSLMARFASYNEFAMIAKDLIMETEDESS